MTVAEPRLTLERRLLREHTLVIACDEVGRGALAGPVAVGAAVVDAPRSRKRIPQGLRDSKLVPEPKRADVAARAASWVAASAVGWASSEEIDEIGIMGALRLAGLRALGGLGVVPDLVILDGNHDWLTAATEVGLFAFADDSGPTTPPVTTMIKADLKCSSVAAASVLAKVERDELMIRLGAGHPAYGWRLNKGYAAPEHMDALARLGPCELHRRSWRLPGVYADPPVGVLNEGTETFAPVPTTAEQTGTAIR